MVRRANELHAEFPGVAFVVNTADDLSRFDDGAFDLVCTLLVLQHLPHRAMIEGFLREFVRVLAPGGLLAVQLPTLVPSRNAGGPRSRLRPRTRLAAALRACGVPKAFLYRHLRWRPSMTMSAIPSEDVIAVLAGAGGACSS